MLVLSLLELVVVALVVDVAPELVPPGAPETPVHQRLPANSNLVEGPDCEADQQKWLGGPQAADGRPEDLSSQQDWQRKTEAAGQDEEGCTLQQAGRDEQPHQQQAEQGGCGAHRVAHHLTQVGQEVAHEGEGGARAPLLLLLLRGVELLLVMLLVVWVPPPVLPESVVETLELLLVLLLLLLTLLLSVGSCRLLTALSSFLRLWRRSGRGRSRGGGGRRRSGGRRLGHIVVRTTGRRSKSKRLKKLENRRLLLLLLLVVVFEP